ncbi:MAG: hypothetical protein J1E02_05745, partial [Coprobacter sp.]|nr:hypothetical protein [Coprobacter sp.]
ASESPVLNASISQMRCKGNAIIPTDQKMASVFSFLPYSFVKRIFYQKKFKAGAAIFKNLALFLCISIVN